MDDWYRTVLKPGFDSSIMIRLHEPFNLQINVCIRFLNSAWNVLTPTLQNSSLALFHLGFFKQHTQTIIIGNLELLDARLFKLDL